MTEKIPARKRAPGMEILGFVPDPNTLSDLAGVAVIPLRIGGGIRIKLLELMAMGMAVVSTTVGAQGIGVTHGDDVLLADEPAEFAAAVARLLKSPQKSQRLAKNARRLVEERYSWDAAGDRLVEAVVEMVRRRNELLDAQRVR
jgi:glycosyltransferase involved in cell wall biosynthesis